MVILYEKMRRDVFQAIADPTRREILVLVAANRMNLTSINEKFDISQPAISKHIKILMECELITIEKQGRQRYCEANVEKLHEVEEWLVPFREMWEQRFDELDKLLAGMKSKSNNQLK